MSNIITEPEKARRLARAIASDISLYNAEKIQSSFMNDNFFEVMREELNEGLELFERRVDSGLRKETNFYWKAVVDIIIKTFEYTECSLH